MITKPMTSPKAVEVSEHDPWHTSTAFDIFSAPAKPAAWLVKELEIGPGRPCMFVGGEGAGKTWMTLELARAVATGTPAFGSYQTRQGRVLYLGYDAGRDDTTLRLRRLGNGWGHTLDDFGDRLDVASYPDVYLNSNGSELAFTKKCEGFALVIVDTLSDAAPNEPENAREFARNLNLLARVSERTGAAFVPLHHTGHNNDIRGARAIIQAAGTVWLSSAAGSDCKKLTHRKMHESSLDWLKPVHFRFVVGDAAGHFETRSPRYPDGVPGMKVVAREATLVPETEPANDSGVPNTDQLVELIRTHRPKSETVLFEKAKEELQWGRPTVKAALKAELDSPAPRLRVTSGGNGKSNLVELIQVVA